MKRKLFTLLFAALLSASMYASPTTVPTAADLALKYNVAQNVVLCCYFDMVPCNPVVLAGSYNGWSSDPAECEVFEELDGFAGWYVAQAKYADGFNAKPLQLNNGSFDGWDFQAGDPDAWVWHAGEQADVTSGGYPGEATVSFSGPGAYVYEVKYWKDHRNPCVKPQIHTYKLILLPPTLRDKDFFKPAVSGAFNGWTSEALGEDFYKGNVAYTKTVVAAEGKEFKFLELDFGWKNQFQWKDSLNYWYNFDSEKLPASNADLATIVEVVFDYSDTTKYRYALADATFRDVKVNLTAPVGAPEAGVEMKGEFVGGENYGKGVLMDLVDDVYTATVKSVEAAEFRFREMGNWDNQIQTLNMEDEWRDMGSLQFGEWWWEKEGVYVADIDLSDPNEYKWTNYDPELEPDPVTVVLSEVANYIDFQALSVSDTNMTSYIVTSSSPYELQNGTELRGYQKSDGSESENKWWIKTDYNNVMLTPEWEGVDTLRAGTAFRAGKGTTINLGRFLTPKAGKLVVYFSPNGDSERGISVSIKQNDPIEVKKSGVRIDSIHRPAYAAEFDLPAGSYEKGDVIITAVGNTTNIFGIRIDGYEENPYAISTKVLPKNTGRVSYEYNNLNQATLTASPNWGYHFVQWSDSITDNPRVVKLTQDTAFTAIFAPNIYSLYVTCDSTRGVVFAVNGEYEYGTKVTISASAKYGYHFARWSDGKTQIQRTITITDNIVLEAIFEPNTYIVSAVDNPKGTITGTGSYTYKSVCTVEAHPIDNYHFIRWTDGDRANPRTIVVTKDITLDAVYALDTTGYCGKDYALTWAYNAGSKTLTISGSGSFDEHMECGIEAKQNMEKLVIDEGITAIGAYAFSGCSNLTSIQLPASIKTIGDKAFENCLDLISIYNYRERPCLVSTSAFDGVNKFDCTLYVLAGSVAMYKSEGSNWKDFYFIEPIGSVPVTEPVTDVETQPADNNVTITWPVVNGTDTYTVVILKNGIVVCTLIFSADGQLTGIAFAPGRDGGHQTPAATFTENGGMRFTVTGLESGTNYQLKVTAKDASDKEMATYSSEFKTTSNEEIATGIESQELKTNSQKLLINGQVLILRGDKTYTITGQEVR